MALASQIVSSLQSTPAAWLMHPSNENDDDTPTRCFLNLREQNLYNIKNVFEPLIDAWNLTMVVIYRTPSKLAFCMHGDNTWTNLGSTGTRADYSDIICYNNLLHALTDSGSVEVWDFLSRPPLKITNFGPSGSTADLLDTEATHPLVCPYRTKQFHVYKLDGIRSIWEKVEYLPDRAMFLGGNPYLSLSITDLRGCESNTIYFTDDNRD
ncbi:F-box protein At4g35733-like [Alnus glutinosa]|uniref:F-box protein At4g35733-like n=1 Tax=Alnus glutinosa TaxID=3517 RepID=UPI002D790E08|nr:F-box protein At4g35733-like [Alnus glutinosa]